MCGGRERDKEMERRYLFFFFFFMQREGQQQSKRKKNKTHFFPLPSLFGLFFIEAPLLFTFF